MTHLNGSVFPAHRSMGLMPISIQRVQFAANKTQGGEENGLELGSHDIFFNFCKFSPNNQNRYILYSKLCG